MLEVINLTKKYGDKTVVDHLTFSVSSGEVFGLLGRNGAGKTTTIKMMLGLVTQDVGTVMWKNQNGLKGASFGYLPEERGLYPKAKVVDQLSYFARLEGMNKSTIKRSIDYWLERFDIEMYRNKMAGDLSKGNQQKVQLVATLLHNPDLIILDEPFSGLDPVNTNLLTEVILEEKQKGKVIIMSSHQMEQVEKFCKEVIIMKDGKALLTGELEVIKDSYGLMYLSLYGNVDKLKSFCQQQQYSFEQEEKRIIIPLNKEQDPLMVLMQLKNDDIAVSEVTYLQPTLHQIFVEKVGS
ncbi:ATP-binding cassette domain-containing protein [Neobacillus niacini]|uniref:ABC transporter ATP-binding protein n=1 Tax=Neobacillus niacini TaxID=86668 RepID=UPI0007ABA4CD|nr:ATP-binding cassette domain-containing protein [Neobacillus niacini]MEC1524239.1 ATP-binding cassette domain-containing protein [Neobacillus niacini]